MDINTVTLRVGIWEHKVGVYFQEHHLPLLRSMGLWLKGGCAMELFWWPETRELTMRPTHDAGARLHRSAEPDVWPYRLDILSVPDTARCEIMALEFDISESEPRLTAVLPKDYDLPWPRLRDCRSFDKIEVARREIHLRLAALQKDGKDIILHGIPEEYQRVITAEERLSIHTGVNIIQPRTQQQEQQTMKAFIAVRHAHQNMKIPADSFEVLFPLDQLSEVKAALGYSAHTLVNNLRVDLGIAPDLSGVHIKGNPHSNLRLGVNGVKDHIGIGKRNREADNAITQLPEFGRGEVEAVLIPSMQEIFVPLVAPEHRHAVRKHNHKPNVVEVGESEGRVAVQATASDPSLDVKMASLYAEGSQMVVRNPDGSSIHAELSFMDMVDLMNWLKRVGAKYDVQTPQSQTATAAE